MRLKYATFLILISCLHVFASGHAQKVTLSARNASLLEVMDQIEKQTGYTFWMQSQLMRDVSKVNIQAKNASLTTVLDKLFGKHKLEYTIIEKTIVVRSSRSGQQESFQEPVTHPLESRPVNDRIQWPDRLGKSERVPELRHTAEHEVRGTVKDESGTGLPGVSVMIKGTQRGVSTDVNGEFSLLVPDENAVLVFSFVGYISREIIVGSRSTLEITLEPDLKALDELVVIGYGVVRKSDLTGSVSQVKAKELNAFPNANVLQSLSGRVPGVHVRQSSGAPGAGISVRVRGGNSIQGSNEPLYVIDGFPVDGNPTHLNNSDIESLEILKDASATAIYGSRGANGVVLITTRKGRKGKTQVDFETSYSSQKLIKKLDLMNAREYAQFYNEQAINDNIQPFFTQEQIANMGEGFDWQDFVF